MTAARSEQGRRLLDEALRLLDVAQASWPPGAAQACGVDAGSECRFCPLCRGIAYLREVDPQAVERLTGAVADLAGAVRDLLGSAPVPAAGDRREGEGEAPDAAGAGPAPAVPRMNVQHIDVSD